MPIYGFFAKVGTIVATERQRVGPGLKLLASIGALAVLPWVFVTLVEIDRGWGDAIWQHNPWRRDAIVLTWIGALAGLTAAAETFGGGPRRLVYATLGVQLAAGLAWTVLLFATPS